MKMTPIDRAHLALRNSGLIMPDDPARGENTWHGGLSDLPTGVTLEQVEQSIAEQIEDHAREATVDVLNRLEALLSSTGRAHMYSERAFKQAEQARAELMVDAGIVQ